MTNVFMKSTLSITEGISTVIPLHIKDLCYKDSKICSARFSFYDTHQIDHKSWRSSVLRSEFYLHLPAYSWWSYIQLYLNAMNWHKAINLNFSKGICVAQGHEPFCTCTGFCNWCYLVPRRARREKYTPNHIQIQCALFCT